ncbi:MAG TPA: hypothetical protein VFG51_03500 [Candidatus Saccharimonadia bacterium]|nr:hypothetical protein [Candidatus Saccharimonadia bacterium]
MALSEQSNTSDRYQVFYNAMIHLMETKKWDSVRAADWMRGQGTMVLAQKYGVSAQEVEELRLDLFVAGRSAQLESMLLMMRVRESSQEDTVAFASGKAVLLITYAKLAQKFSISIDHVRVVAKRVLSITQRSRRS